MPELAVRQVETLLGSAGGPVCLLQCGRPSPVAPMISELLAARGLESWELIVDDREVAKADETLDAVHAASAIWVFSENMFDTFMTVFATPLSFALRSATKAGKPTAGVGGAALALGSLLLARHLCHETLYQLSPALGWAPRVLFDAEIEGGGDPGLGAQAAASLPSLMSVQLGETGAVRVEGGHFESVGTEAIMVTGSESEDGPLRTLTLEPGTGLSFAPPPFAPFDPNLLPWATSEALRKAGDEHAYWEPREILTAPESAPEPHIPAFYDRRSEAAKERGRYCPLCNQRHADRGSRAA